MKTGRQSKKKRYKKKAEAKKYGEIKEFDTKTKIGNYWKRSMTKLDK